MTAAEASDPPAAAQGSGVTERSREEQLLELVGEITANLDHAVRLAAAIGPEWENVVDDIRAPVLDQLADLARRLSARAARQERP